MDAPELSHALGDTGRFEILRVLGEGGMGTVYEALDRERFAPVAIKVLREVNPDARFRFKQEFRSLQGIHHPNLVSLGELFEQGGYLFFTMELVDGVHFLEHVRGAASAPAARTMPSPSRVESTRVTSRSASPSTPPPSDSLPRPVVVVDEARARAAFSQLARGLHALHLAGKVHRDIKPSNVLVDEGGRVVILDFGLVQNAAHSERDFLVVGTARYMAPEQAAGEAVGPAADWYSVGVMLYLVLTGSFPFRPSSQVRPSSRRRGDAPSPSLFFAGLPPDLEALCVDLLRADPAARPNGAAVLRRLGVDEAPSPLLQRGEAAWFVGRHAELAALDAALAAVTAGAPRVVLIEGAFGMGKTALMRRFLERAPAEAVVLRGRCYERDSVPYKAVDALMDNLAVHLAHLDLAVVEALLPPDIEQLEQVFPVLRLARAGRLPSFALASANGERSAPTSVPLPLPSDRAPPRSAPISLDPITQRARIFAALRELFRRLAARAPLVLTIDDLQWADADSLALLSEVLRAPSAPGLLLVATLRTGAGITPSRLASVFAKDALSTLTIDRLSQDDGRDLVGSLLDGATRSSPPEPGAPIHADSLVEEAGGHPLFIDALLRHRLVKANDGGPVLLDDALWARIQRLERGARRLLDLIAVAEAPLGRDVAEFCEAAEIAEVPRLLVALQAENLIRVAGAGRDETLETFHDRVRETVLRRLDPEEQRALHARLAAALVASGSAELEELARHFRAAGDRATSLAYTVSAADQAARAFAFDHASRLYRTALALAEPDADAERALEEKLGDALANAGRGAEAAEAYLRAGRGMPEVIRLDLERRAAENFLRSGYVDEGLRTLRDVVAARGLHIPKTPERALAALLFRRAELRLRGLAFTPRPAREVPAERLARIDLCWSAALGLALVDAVRGANFQTQNLLLSLQAGEPYRVSRALSCEAAFLSTEGGDAQARVDDLLDRAEAIAVQTAHPHALGLVAFTTGVTRYCVGRFRESLDALDRADVIFRERGVSVPWEHGSAASFATCDLWLLGDLRELARRVPLYLREAADRGDRFLITNLSTGFNNAYWLLSDDPDRAASEAEAGMGAWSKEGFHIQHFQDFLARGHIALYRGDGASAHARLVSEWPRLARSLTLRLQLVRIFSVQLRARTALAAALESRSPRALLREVDRDASRIVAERMAWADPLAALVRAGAAHLRGDDALALARLDEAIHGLHQAGLALFEAAARLRRGRLEGGDAGRAEAALAERWMRDRGVLDPERTAAMMAPGFRE